MTYVKQFIFPYANMRLHARAEIGYNKVAAD